MTCRSNSWPLLRRTAGLGLAAGLVAASPPVLAQEPLAQEPLAQESLAQEPLFLRIRPSDAPPREIGAGGSDAEIAKAARAARETVWERSTVRANLAIASVCTGCLGPKPVPLPLRPERPRTITPPESVQATLAPADPSDGAAARPAIADPTSTRGDP